MAKTEDRLSGRGRPSTIDERIQDLRARKAETLEPGGKDAVKKQHERGKLTARERVALLMDKGSFVEMDSLARHRATDFGLDRTRPPGDGVITGFGTIDGRKVFVFSQDFTVLAARSGR
jgi:propionyl-CoA carboxylase beta chain